LAEWGNLIVAEWGLTTIHGDNNPDDVNPLPWLNRKARGVSSHPNPTGLCFEPLFTPSSYLTTIDQGKTETPVPEAFSKHLSAELSRRGADPTITEAIRVFGDGNIFLPPPGSVAPLASPKLTERDTWSFKDDVGAQYEGDPLKMKFKFPPLDGTPLIFLTPKNTMLTRAYGDSEAPTGPFPIPISASPPAANSVLSPNIDVVKRYGAAILDLINKEALAARVARQLPCGLLVDSKLDRLSELQSPAAILGIPSSLQANVRTVPAISQAAQRFRDAVMNTLRDATIRIFGLSMGVSPTEVRAHLEPAVMELQADSIAQAKALVDLLVSHHRNVGHITNQADSPLGTLCELSPFYSVFR
jgi:hypothetical protein